jgi:hypothetical protein
MSVIMPNDPFTVAMKVETETERKVLRAVLSRDKTKKWAECPCGWFYLESEKRCPDAKCPHRKNTIAVKLYVHGDDESEYHRGQQLGIKDGEALDRFSGWSYEIEFDAEVNIDTGEVKLLKCDGKWLQD